MDMKGCLSLITLYRARGGWYRAVLNLEADKNALNKNAKTCFGS